MPDNHVKNATRLLTWFGEWFEVDGKDHRTAEDKQRDAIRDRFLRSQGDEVLTIEGFRVT